MISLVIVIIVTLILVAIATVAGFNYINRANKLKADALEKTIGEAAYNRQNDLSSGVSNRFYDGYAFSLDGIRNNYTEIEGLPTDENGKVVDDDHDGIPDVFQKPGANWYVIDADSASSLGANETEGLLTRNITPVPGDNRGELVQVVLVDYTNGDAYYVTMPKGLIYNTINQGSDCPNSPSGMHRFTIATCTEPSKCIYCGLINTHELGHDWVEATCTAPQTCKRCGTIGEPAKGHDFIKNDEIDEYREKFEKNNFLIYENTMAGDTSNYAWITDALKHWHECKVCGERLEEQVHDKNCTWQDVSEYSKYHHETCSICGWTSVLTPHNFETKMVTDSTHEKICTICGFTATHDDGHFSNHTLRGWKDGNNLYHYRTCWDDDSCNTKTITLQLGDPELDGTDIKVAFLQEHIDENHDFICDVATCQRKIDRNPPKDFGLEDFGTYGRIIDATTYSLTAEAYTIDDELGVSYYQFGIYDSGDNKIIWNDASQNVSVSSDRTKPARYTFEKVKQNKNLKPDTNYTIYVRAFDENGNSNTPYPINGRTAAFPDFNGINNVPEGFVKGPIEIGINKIDTELENITLLYSLDSGDTWITVSDDIKNDKVENHPITLTKEKEVIDFKYKDEKGNELYIKRYIIDKIDNDPPDVTITPKNDQHATSSAQHYATIKIEDDRSGIAQGTTVRYGWSTSLDSPPSNYITYKTENLQTQGEYSFDVPTPSGVEGKYYLWVDRGVEDAVGNATTEPVKCPLIFNVDDVEAEIINIKMLDLTPAVDGQILFVKTGGEVTITFTANKDLGENPTVRLNERIVSNITHSGRDYTCKMIIDESFAEGPLELTINNVVSSNGKLNTRIYNNDDLVEGPVIYDKTLPAIEYIPKS